METSVSMSLFTAKMFNDHVHIRAYASYQGSRYHPAYLEEGQVRIYPRSQPPPGVHPWMQDIPLENIILTGSLTKGGALTEDFKEAMRGHNIAHIDY